MIKIIVCDDIPVIRENIASLLRQNHPEWTIYSDYYDGGQVIEHLKKEPVDLIISDIKMKDITGIDILKFIYEKKLPTHVIIITAYSDFEYAKDAVNYNAAHFLVKPLNPCELLSVAAREIELIRQERDAKSSELTVVNQLLLRNKMHQMLEQLHSNRSYFSIFRDYCRQNNPNYLEMPLSYIRLKRQPDTDVSEYFSWYDATACHNRYINAYIVTQNAAECTLLVFTEASQEGTGQLEAYLQRLEKYLVASYSFENISRLYGEDSDIAMRYIICMENCDYEQRLELEKQIVQNFSVAKKLSLVSRICNYYKIEDMSARIASASTKESADKLFRLVTEKLEQLLVYNSKQLWFEKVRHYLEENFGDPMLSLDSVSRAFNFSPSYMSKQFTDYYGISFTETLTSLRLEHAKELLKNPNTSIREVATACGYNEKYFSKLFTRKFGMNPRTYRDRRAYDDIL